MGFPVISPKDRQPSNSMGDYLPDQWETVCRSGGKTDRSMNSKFCGRPSIPHNHGHEKNWQRRGYAAFAANFVRQTGIFISGSCLSFCQSSTISIKVNGVQSRIAPQEQQVIEPGEVRNSSSFVENAGRNIGFRIVYEIE